MQPELNTVKQLLSLSPQMLCALADKSNSQLGEIVRQYPNPFEVWNWASQQTFDLGCYEFALAFNYAAIAHIKSGNCLHLTPAFIKSKALWETWPGTSRFNQILENLGYKQPGLRLSSA